MEFDHLKGFYNVAKLGSFTEAAERLFISQPAISLQVKALENEVGQRLFDRVGRTIRLTHAGRILYTEVEELMGKWDGILQTVNDFKSLECGRLAVGASDTMSIHFLPDLLMAFLKEHPKIELSIVSLVSDQVIRKVKERELDLGIVTLPFKEPQLDVIPAFEQRLVCIVSPRHAFTQRSVIDLREVAAEQVILLDKACRIRQRIDECLASEGCKCRPILELSNFEIIKRYVAVGLGVSLVPQGAVSSSRDDVIVVPLKQRLCLKMGIVFRRERRLSHPARAFLEMASEYFRGGWESEPRETGPVSN